MTDRLDKISNILTKKALAGLNLAKRLRGFDALIEATKSETLLEVARVIKETKEKFDENSN